MSDTPKIYDPTFERAVAFRNKERARDTQELPAVTERLLAEDRKEQPTQSVEAVPDNIEQTADEE